ncbi:MAG: hypothetical protein ACLPV8_05475 [Steroidobacteraceae bacterium]
MLKLFGEKYAIEFSALSKAAVAALIIGKIIAILDWAQSGRRFDTHRPIVVIICKTLIYGLVVFVLGIAEKIFHESRAAGSLRGGIHGLIVNANLDRSFGIISLITSVIGSYLLLQEIDRAMGKGALLTLLFSRPIKPPATEQ